MSKKFVYFFSEKKTDGDKSMKDLLGGKGANLAQMAKLGIPLPPGFTISTEVCKEYYDNNKQYPASLQKQIDENLLALEKAVGKKFGDASNPLLVSVRSGAASSMPGMMDTVLNLGLNDQNVQTLARDNQRFAWDAYRRLINMFGDVVMGVEHSLFEKALNKQKAKQGVKLDTDLTAEDLEKVCADYKKIIKNQTKKDFPQNPRTQLQMAIDAVFGSWNNNRAIKYRKLNKIKGLIGTAVNVQAMVFGNMGKTSGTGVAFTRNPSTGENVFYGEYLMNAQGEDVVAGIRTPKHIDHLAKQNPAIYKKLLLIRKKLEHHYKDMQDIEFTIEQGKLYILQTRNGKRTGAAAVNIAVDMVREKMITKKEAILRVAPNQLEQLLHKRISQSGKKQAKIIAQGLPASPGAAVGQVYFSSEHADKMAKSGERVVLVRTETSPEDIEGMASAQGILTARGGMTSHAAVVARGMGKCCVAGCNLLNINEKAKYFTADDIKVKEGEWISLDGATGEVILGQTAVVDPEFSGNFGVLMDWADQFRKLGVMANADTPIDAKNSLKFKAEGIGLCRTEHMFFDAKRISAVRQMILADDLAGREKALKKIAPMQKKDFKALFKEMDGRAVTVRLLDPPLHEFLPADPKEIQTLARIMNVSVQKINEKIASLHELNPMLGHRGCRLAITYPEILKMQSRAIIEAACEVKKAGIKVAPEIMIPLVGFEQELSYLRKFVEETASKVLREQAIKIDYKIGTMIEVPRGALTADLIAKNADFFSFGTNDLTQMTLGFSRDDVGKFVPEYIEKGILEDDPFQTLDQEGVGKLVEMAVAKGRSHNPNLKCGVCGEHGGEAQSVEFFHRIGLDYVSCSPFRIPVARFAAAQAQLKYPRK